MRNLLQLLWGRSHPTALASEVAPAALPAVSSPLLPVLPEWATNYPPRLSSAPVYFDSSFTLQLARPYDDNWASNSSLLATPAVPVLVWVRNQRDELVAHHVFTSSPIQLGEQWWPGIYTVQVEHPDFRDVLCAYKQGAACTDMPPLDLLAPPNASLPALPANYEGQALLDPGTSATLME